MLSKTKILPTIAAVAVCFGSTNGHASLSDQMDTAFNAMVNVTDAGAYNTARRGVLSGGQIFIKMPTKRVNLLSATAPRITAGCGGINLYGGSFSFINADQFLENFQAIGANALGYGVKLALSSACPTCEQVMTSLEKTAQAINKMNMDSCQAAQGLVDAGVEYAQTQSADAKSKLRGIEGGIMDDVATAWSWGNTETTSATNADKNADAAGYAAEITGNIAWRSFKASGVSSVFGGDDSFLEMLMTMTGTVIVDNPSTDADSDPKLMALGGHNIKLLDLISGGTIKTYSCNGSVSNDGCLSVNSSMTGTVTDEGLRQRIYEAFTDSDGYIKALQTDTEWSNKAKSVLGLQTLTGMACTRKIRQGAINKVPSNLLIGIAETCSNRMALEASHALAISYIDTARSTLLRSDVPENLAQARERALAIFKESEDYYNKEYTQLAQKASYQNIITYLESLNITNGTLPSTTGGK